MATLSEAGLEFTDQEKKESYYLLKNQEVYKLQEIKYLTNELMRALSMNYRPIFCERSLKDFTPEEKKRLWPFALFLSCLDGNAFPPCIEQYIPEAYQILKDNNWLGRAMEIMDD